MRQLASIQLIDNIEPIENADNLLKATVLGWHVVIRKDDNFNIGDKIVYVEIDSILPKKPEFEFLAPRKYRIKTIKLRGQISQGIIFPLSILPQNREYNVGDDVTDIIGITKYDPEAEVEANDKPVKRKKLLQYLPNCVKSFLYRILPKSIFFKLFGNPQPKKYSWPDNLPHTDETRVQVLQPLLDEYKGQEFYITEKVDGSSLTAIYDIKRNTFRICSRNLCYDINSGNKFAEAAKKYDIEKKLKEYCIANNRNIAIQGELLGPKIQGNKYELEDYDIYFFSVFDMDNIMYLPYGEAKSIIDSMGLKFVPLVRGSYMLENDIDKLVEMARGKSVVNKKIHREGIVIRLLHPTKDHVSFKAINPDFLLKFDG